MWERKRLNVPINPSEIEPTLSSTLQSISSSLEVLVEGLELVRQLAIDFDEPIFSKLARGLKETLISFTNTGLYMCQALPDIDRVISTEQALDLLSSSLLDYYDGDRPIIEGTAYVDMVIFAIESGTLGGFVEIIRLLKQLIRIPDLIWDYDLANWNKPGEDYNLIEGKGQYPDWTSANAFDLFPFLGEAVSGIISVLDLFIIPNLDDLLAEGIAILNSKIDILNRLIATINLLNDAYISIQNLGDFLVYRIKGEHDASSLAGEVVKARTELIQLRKERQEVIVDRTFESTSVLVEVFNSGEGNVVGGVIAIASASVDSTIFDAIFGV